MNYFKIFKRKNLISKIKYKLIVVDNQLAMCNRDLHLHYSEKQALIISSLLDERLIYKKALNKIYRL